MYPLYAIEHNVLLDAVEHNIQRDGIEHNVLLPNATEHNVTMFLTSALLTSSLCRTMASFVLLSKSSFPSPSP